VGLVVGSWTLALYAVTFVVVRQHYSEHLPHYDSIGHYADLYRLVNDAHRHGMLSVLPGPFRAGTSWLQPAYALALSWAPIKSPEWLVSLNFVLLLAAQGAIVAYGQTFGFSRLRQFVSTVIPIIPGALYAWDGGIQDLRRDSQLVLLALAILFMALAYVASPSWARGAALGLLVGLAQWSRDNAAAVIVIVVTPPLVLAIVHSRRAGGVTRLARLGVVPVGVFLLVTMPYYALTLPSTMERYSTSVWGVGESRFESLLAFWNMPFNVLFGGDSRLSGRVRVALVTVALLATALATTFVLWRACWVRIDAGRLREPAYALLLAGGAWVISAVFLYNTVLLGYGARWHAVPFLPIMVGLVAILVGLTGAVRRRPRPGRGMAPRAIVGVAGMVLLLSAPLRMLLNQQSAVGVEQVDAVRAASFEIAGRVGDRPMGFLSYDRFSRHHVRYYLSQADRPEPKKFELVARTDGDIIDLDRPLRPGEQPEDLRGRLDRALRRSADFVLVMTDTSRYEGPRETLWPYQFGRPVVDGLLSDPQWRPVSHMSMVERDFVLLENLTDQSARRSSR
jgi:hypothetical protein